MSYTLRLKTVRLSLLYHSENCFRILSHDHNDTIHTTMSMTFGKFRAYSHYKGCMLQLPGIYQLDSELQTWPSMCEWNCSQSPFDCACTTKMYFAPVCIDRFAFHRRVTHQTFRSNAIRHRSVPTVIRLSPCQPDYTFESSTTIKVINMQIIWPSLSS